MDTGFILYHKSNSMTGTARVIQPPTFIYNAPIIMDTYITDCQKRMSYGYNTTVYCGILNGANYKIEVAPDLSKIPADMKIKKAELIFKKSYMSYSGNLSLHKLNSQWQENNISWYKHPEICECITKTSLTVDDNYVKFDITNSINDCYVNKVECDGFNIESDNFIGLNSRESDNKPYIRIEYTNPALLTSADDIDGYINIVTKNDSNISGYIDIDRLHGRNVELVGGDTTISVDKVKGDITVSKASSIDGIVNIAYRHGLADFDGSTTISVDKVKGDITVGKEVSMDGNVIINKMAPTTVNGDINIKGRGINITNGDLTVGYKNEINGIVSTSIKNEISGDINIKCNGNNTVNGDFPIGCKNELNGIVSTSIKNEISGDIGIPSNTIVSDICVCRQKDAITNGDISVISKYVKEIEGDSPVVCKSDISGSTLINIKAKSDIAGDLYNASLGTSDIAGSSPILCKNDIAGSTLINIKAKSDIAGDIKIIPKYVKEICGDLNVIQSNVTSGYIIFV